MILALLLACAPPAELVCAAELSPDAPVATVSWATEEPVEGQVAYGTDGALDEQTAAVSATEHSHLLLGLPPDRELSWQVTAGDQACSGSLWTDPLPSWVALPEVVTGGDEQGGDTGSGAWLAAVFGLGSYASQILVFDRQGTVRWHHLADQERFLVDVQVARDGGGVLYDQFHNRFSEDLGVIRRIAWQGTVQEEVAIPDGHHMFAQLPDGTLAYQAIDAREWTDPATGEVQTLVGDAIRELGPDGELVEVFNAWDHLEPQPNSFSSLPSIYPQGVDWTHGNALKHDEDADTWLLSLGNAGSVLTIDRATGQPLEIVGAYGLPVAEGSPALEHQHDPTWLSEDRLLVFDTHFEDFVSGAYEYTLVDGQLELSWQYQSADRIFALILGQAQRLPDGGTWINFGSGGVIEQLDAWDQLSWRVELPDDLGFAQVRWLADFPTP